MESELSNLEYTNADLMGNSLDDFTPLYSYIQSLESQREHEKSRELLSNLMDIIQGSDRENPHKSPGHSTIYRLMAGNYMALGQVAESSRLYRESLELFPDDDELRIDYGGCLACLHQFEASEKVLNLLADPVSHLPHRREETGLYTYRKNAALGEMYLSWNKFERAGVHFRQALEFGGDWIPAHLGLVELDLIHAKTIEAEEYLFKLFDTYGEDPELMLAAANLALITSNFEDADNFIFKSKGALLGDDRFEYLLFKLDFFQGDEESLEVAPYRLTGQTVETEAARAWLMNFKSEPFAKDPSRIPEEIWCEERQALDLAWKQVCALK